MLYMRGIKLLALNNAANAQIQQLLKGYQRDFCCYRSNSISLKKFLICILANLFSDLASQSRAVPCRMPDPSGGVRLAIT